MFKTMAISAIAAFALLVTSCNNHDSPTASHGSGTWTLTSTVSSTDGTDGCIQAPTGGATPSPRQIIINGSSIRFLNVAFCEDCPVFNGTLSGDAFTASADISFDSSECGGHVQGSDVITGTFSSNRLQLTATDVTTYIEPSGHQVVIRYATTGTRD
jgi:hypothetical protein